MGRRFSGAYAGLTTYLGESGTASLQFQVGGAGQVDIEMLWLVVSFSWNHLAARLVIFDLADFPQPR